VGVHGEGEVAQAMYTHESKCKNDKIKEKKETITQCDVQKKKGRKASYIF
jgi:hypothetical protein